MVFEPTTPCVRDRYLSTASERNMQQRLTFRFTPIHQSQSDTFSFVSDDSVKCLLMKFGTIYAHNNSDITLHGVECETIVDAEIVCETKSGKVKP